MTDLSGLLGLKEAYGPNVYFYDGPINESGFSKLANTVLDALSIDDADETAIPTLFLTTDGGDASAAFKIAKFLHGLFGGFELAIPKRCYSAGTLVALGAQKIRTNSFSEMGPLDVQILMEDELGKRRSGLTTASAFQALESHSFSLFSSLMLGIKSASQNAITFKLSSELAASLTGELMAPIYAQISPSALGADDRRLRVAFEYGNRLANFSQNLKEGTLDKLVHGYPQHEFMIGEEEISELFKNVDRIDGHYYSLSNGLRNSLRSTNPNSLKIYSLASLIALENDSIDIESDKEDSFDHEPDTSQADEAKTSQNGLDDNTND